MESRLAALQTANPTPISILRTWGPYDRPTALAIEHDAHSELWDGHATGEWFRIDAAELVGRTHCTVESWHLEQMAQKIGRGNHNFRSTHLLTDAEHREMVVAGGFNAAYAEERHAAAALMGMAQNLDGTLLENIAAMVGCERDIGLLHGELNYLMQLNMIDYRPIEGVLRIGDPEVIAPNWWAAKRRSPISVVNEESAR